MSEQRHESPLQSDRGSTTLSESVVARIAGLAAREIEGVHMGGGTARKAGGIMSRASSTQDETRGVPVEVGNVEAAIDLKLALEYGLSLPETAEALRSRIRDQVENMTGLRVSEINITVDDFIFPDDGEAKTYTGRSERTRELEPQPEQRSEETTPSSREAHSGREEVRVENRPLRRGEAADLDASDDDVETRPIVADETRRDAETSGGRETAHGSAPEDSEGEEERRG